MTSNSNPPALPVGALLVAATLWGLFWIPLRLLAAAGMHGIWSTLIMYTAALAVGVPLAWHHRAELSRRPWLLFGIALANGWANVAFILAVIDGTVVRVMLLFYLSPLWTVALGWLLLDERPNRIGTGAIVLAMSGALLMLWDPVSGTPWPRDEADWLALTAGMAFALSNVLVRKAQDISVRTKTAATWAGVSVMAALLVVFTGSAMPVLEFEIVAWAVLLGAGIIVIMTLAVQYGVTHMPVHRSAVILLFEIVVGAVSSMLLTDERLLAWEWVGGALIIIAGAIAARTSQEADNR